MILVLTALLAVTQAALQSLEKDAAVLRNDVENIGVDGYNFVYETSNGIAQQESVQLKNVGTENEAISVKGKFSYTGTDGVKYVVQYVADENGFQPQGVHLPVAP